MPTMKETFRWFGPNDPVTLADIKQCGCTGVMTALHHIAYGEPWPRAEIAKRKAELSEYDLEWVTAESVPVSEADIREIMGMHDNPANGLCFCTGSYSSRADNDLPEMINQWGHRINAIHLCSTQRNPDGSFYEANHLEGSVDMYAVVKAMLAEMQKRKATDRADWQLAFRPDHGHTMLDDLKKPTTPTPGYSCIGRMRGLAEIRGLQTGIARAMTEQSNPKEQYPC